MVLNGVKSAYINWYNFIEEKHAYSLSFLFNTFFLFYYMQIWNGNDIFFIFGWTISLKPSLAHARALANSLIFIPLSLSHNHTSSFRHYIDLLKSNKYSHPPYAITQGISGSFHFHNLCYILVKVPLITEPNKKQKCLCLLCLLMHWKSCSEENVPNHCLSLDGKQTSMSWWLHIFSNSRCSSFHFIYPSMWQ